MEAVIAAGGKGTRLSSVAKDIPKALVTVGDKPVLEHQITLLKKHGITDIHVLLGYLGDQIKNYFGDGKKWGVNLQYHQEKEPLGRTGALAAMQGRPKEDFLFLSGDIMMDFDVKKFMDWHAQKKNVIASLVVHPSDHLFDSDLVQTGHEDKITSLWLKPHAKDPDPDSLGISSVCILSPEVFLHIPKDRKSDLEKDVLPSLMNSGRSVHAYNTAEYIKDMGTPERLEKVRNEYAQSHLS